MRVFVSVPGRRSFAVACDHGKQCTEVARVEKARAENHERGALIGIEAVPTCKSPPQPLVFWLYDGTGWVKELV